LSRIACNNIRNINRKNSCIYLTFILYKSFFIENLSFGCLLQLFLLFVIHIAYNQNILKRMEVCCKFNRKGIKIIILRFTYTSYIPDDELFWKYTREAGYYCITFIINLVFGQFA